jgi:hypothetical protein
MPLDFPLSPALNQVYSLGGKSWKWNGDAWETYNDNLGVDFVETVNGVTGDVGVVGGTDISVSTAGKTLTINYTGSGGGGGTNVVSSFNGLTGAVQGVSSFNGQTGAVSFHDYVASFNGVTGAVQGLTSLNGKTGAVGISTDRLKGTTLAISGNTLTVGINIYPNGVDSSGKGTSSGIDGTDYLLFQEKPTGATPGKLFYATVSQLFNTPVAMDTVQSISTNDYRSTSYTLVLNSAFEERSISTSTVINEILSLIDGGTFA